MSALNLAARRYGGIVLAAAVVAGLVLTASYNYLLFHSLVELFAIVVAASMFVMAWNTRQFLDNHYLLLLGIAMLFVAGLGLAHVLTYKGMTILAGHDANLPTQLWIAMRCLLASSFLVATVFATRALRPGLAVAAYAGVTAALLLSVFLGVFPDCYVEGRGLTTFKNAGEAVICGLFVVSIGLLIVNRRRFDRGVLDLLLLSLVLGIAAELPFTLYRHVDDWLNMLGHLFVLMSYYVLYKALVGTGLRRPVTLLFRNLKESQEALAETLAEMENRVHTRTSALAAAVKSLETEVGARLKAEGQLRKVNRALRTISECNEVLVRAATEDELLQDVCRIIVQFGGYRAAWVGYTHHDEARTVWPMAQEGLDPVFLESVGITWANVPQGQGPAAHAIRTGRPSDIQDVESDPAFGLWHEEARRHGIASAVAFPLTDDGRPFGALSIYAAEPAAFDVEEMRLLSEMADDLAFGILVLRTRSERERLEREVLQASEDERRRIGQDLHDSLGQTLTGIVFLSSALTQAVESREPGAGDQADQICAMAKEAVKQARGLARGLVPVDLKADGLMAALEGLAANVSDVFKIHCRFECSRPVLIHDNMTATHLYRIAQEATNNAMRHAHAHHVVVRLGEDDGQIVLKIDDDGPGLPENLDRMKGSGLRIMSYRARMIGGTLDVARGPQGGACVVCRLPCGDARLGPSPQAASPFS